MMRAGANDLVRGTSAIYKSGVSLDMKIKEFRKIVDAGM